MGYKEFGQADDQDLKKGEGYVPLSQGPGEGLLLVIRRDNWWCSKRFSITAPERDIDFTLVRKCGLGIKLVLLSQSAKGAEPLLVAKQRPFSRSTRICHVSREPVAILRRRLCHVRDTFEYQGKTYKWDGHIWSCPYHQELIDVDSGKVLAVMEHAGCFKRTCNFTVHADWDQDTLAFMLLAGMVTYRHYKMSKRPLYAAGGGV